MVGGEVTGRCSRNFVVIVDQYTSLYCTCFRLSATPWTVAFQAPLSTRFSRQEYWSGLPRPLPEDLPDPGIEPESFVPPALQLDSLPTEPLRKPLSERWGSQPCHKSRYKYSQVVWWYRAAFGNERAILKYLKGRLVSQNLGLLYEVPMD